MKENHIRITRRKMRTDTHIMKESSKMEETLRRAIRFSIYIIVTLLLFLPPASLAANQTIQQMPKQQLSAPQKKPVLLHPNAPPQGTITITTPTGTKPWHTGSYQIIQWTCTGMRYNSADISLWKDGKLYADIGKGVGTGRTAYIVPFDAAAGIYELRVTSDSDPRVGAKLPITVGVTRVTPFNPPSALLSGSLYTIKWTYFANLSEIKLSVLDSSGAVVKEFPHLPLGTAGSGSQSWMVPLPPAGKTSAQYRFSVTGRFHADVKNNDAWVDRVIGQSDLFTVRLPKISVGSFAFSAKVAQCSPGRQYPQTWDSELEGKPVKIELCNANSGKAVHTIQASIPSQAKNSTTWTAPNIPATLSREGLTVRITSLDNPAVFGVGDIFSCEKPWITLVSPDPQKNLQMNGAYQIGWKYNGDPGPHVRVDLLSAKAGGSNMQVFETPSQSAAVQGSSGKWGEGQIAWTLTNKGPQSQFYIQIRGIEDPNVYDRKQYWIGGATGSSGTTTTTVTTGTTTGSTSTGTSAGACPVKGNTYQETLSSDKTFKYNATDSATFQKGTPVKLTYDNYVVEGYLNSSQSLKYKANQSVKMYSGAKVTFGNCYLTSGLTATSSSHRLEYRSGKFAEFQGGVMTTFENGYVTSGYLALGSDPTLEYRSGKSAKFHAGAKTAFKNGYVTSSILSLDSDQKLEYRPGQTAIFRAGAITTFNSTAVLSSMLALRTEQSLEYKSGKSATFTSTSPLTFRDDGYVKSCILARDATLEYAPGKTKTWQAGTWPIFNNEGYTTTH
jgi:hypothetical protein